MQKNLKALIEPLTAWGAILLLVISCTGCAKINVYKGNVINPTLYELNHMTEKTKGQILSNNCKLDYQPKYCKKGK